MFSVRVLPDTIGGKSPCLAWDHVVGLRSSYCDITQHCRGPGAAMDWKSVFCMMEKLGGMACDCEKPGLRSGANPSPPPLLLLRGSQGRNVLPKPHAGVVARPMETDLVLVLVPLSSLPIRPSSTMALQLWLHPWQYRDVQGSGR